VSGGERETWANALRMLAVWLGTAGLLAMFHRTRAGVAIAAAGANERFAITAGIPVARMRRLGVVLSMVLAAAGIIVYSHGLGLVQLYKAPLLMALPAVAALLLGGATTSRATVLHAVVGTLLFQSLLTISSPVMNGLAQASGVEALQKAPEIARAIIQNGVILYALTRRG
jgi:simple sugar transport system permease protein